MIWGAKIGTSISFHWWSSAFFSFDWKSFLSKRYPPNTARAHQRNWNATFIPTRAVRSPIPSEPIISPILLENSCIPAMSPLSFGFAYPRMSAEVIGCSIAIANDSPKLATTIAIKLLVLPSQKNNPAENKTSIVIRIFLLYLSQIFPIKILTK